jgi:hypothetical protein
MQRTQSQPSSWEAAVNRRDAERKDRAITRDPALQPLDAFAQLGDNRVDGVVTHAKWHLLRAFQR